jgi:predicted acylesterase/phospholipase RssA
VVAGEDRLLCQPASRSEILKPGDAPMSSLTRREALKAAALTLPMTASSAMGAESAQGKKYLILSCDGGGIRGLMTAKIIQRLQKEVPFLDQVDLYAGTSTGGIIALGLANKLTPTDLVKLYRERGPEIFRTRSSPESSGVFHDIFGRLEIMREMFINKLQFDPRDLFHPMYTSDGLERVLKDFFGNTTLVELKSAALVTTLRLSARDKSWAPLILHNVGEEGEAADNTRLQDRPTRLTSLVDAALSTSAAPLYFQPHLNPGFGYCVDGGLFANCPASIALGLACRANKGNVNNIRILSIGTGAQISGIDIANSPPFDKPTEYGALAWLSPVHRGEQLGKNEKEKLTPAFPLISALFDASSASHNYVCDQALDTNYRRVQVTLPKPISLDDTSEDSLKFLENADTFIPDEEWKKTIKWLKDQLA